MSQPDMRQAFCKKKLIVASFAISKLGVLSESLLICTLLQGLLLAVVGGKVKMSVGGDVRDSNIKVGYFILSTSEAIASNIDTSTRCGTSPSIQTSLQTSIRRLAIRFLISVYLMEGKPQFGQERACSMENVAPYPEHIGVASCNGGQVHHESPCKAKVFHWKRG